jgi:hypothetical protein
VIAAARASAALRIASRRASACASSSGSRPEKVTGAFGSEGAGSADGGGGGGAPARRGDGPRRRTCATSFPLSCRERVIAAARASAALRIAS